MHRALKAKGPVTVPREFVFMDRAAIGLGGVFLHLRAEINFYRLFNEAIENFSTARVAATQARALAAAALLEEPPAERASRARKVAVKPIKAPSPGLPPLPLRGICAKPRPLAPLAIGGNEWLITARSNTRPQKATISPRTRRPTRSSPSSCSSASCHVVNFVIGLAIGATTGHWMISLGIFVFATIVAAHGLATGAKTPSIVHGHPFAAGAGFRRLRLKRCRPTRIEHSSSAMKETG